MKGTLPIGSDMSSTVLCGLARIAMTCEHWIDRSGNLYVSLEYGFANLLVSSLFAQIFKLIVQIEDHRWPSETSGRAAGPWVHADDKEGLTAKAE